MANDEEILTGGNVNHIVRTADTVRRPVGYWSPNVHELLLHLEKQRFAGAPRFLGIDNSGREILSYIAGEVPGNAYPELKPYMWSDETLAGVARLMRSYHDAAEGFTPVAGGSWQLSYADPEAYEVICHNDAALYNVVFQHDVPVALIDFDMAGPGPRMWDIAYSMYTSVPLASFVPDYATGHTGAYQSNLHAADRRRRIALFFSAYGIPVPADLQKWIIERLTAMCDTLKNGAEGGNPAFIAMVDEGHLAHYEREIRFVANHFTEWC
ncbi:phosphotransferase [Paenibacillus sp. MMS20-IR301]|uniref:phosphotransferase n=1 Tax=Paenibacillus sp. MMS20-IR301 TaxID=2895946 RepID=UPI0028EB8834|nr:phosphotransferase [Paenibacillus sp. MMS20-IR301]WNS44893.1 phosphotransferase [Paenibacillus sp. MMS20-IR301]